MDENTTVVADGSICIVDRTAASDRPARFGLDTLIETIEAAATDVRSVNYWSVADSRSVIVVGTGESRVVRRLLGAESALDQRESIVYRWCRTDAGTALVVAGGDSTGLMYGLLELAERVEADGVDALDQVSATVQTPSNAVRGIDRFIETPVEDDWLTDETFWEYYLDRLARDRFNRFVLITGYDTAFMSPPYPFLVSVPGFPAVSVDAAVERETYRSMLRFIGRACHERGIEFLFGIWQQQPWTEYQGVDVHGLPDGEDLEAYCAAGLKAVLTACPEIDGIQLRVNYESGVAGEGTATAERFWHRIIDAVAAAGTERGDEPVLDLRAKGLTDGMIDHALATGLDVAVPTKFWCESTGLPHHNTVMRAGELANLDDPNRARRYSYADLLARPRAYDMLYRLWAIGTNRVFVWGDPDYARRFSHATRFGDAQGFEITAPLSLKGGYHGLRTTGWPLFADPEDRWYDWEDERYWAWYRLFGRLGYDDTADPAVWRRSFETAYGDVATPMARAYRSASKILPLLTAAHLTSHPALHNWAELDTGGALFAAHNANEAFGDTTYGSTEPSDPGLFYAIDEFVTDRVADAVAGKYTPIQVAGWYESLADATRTAIESVYSSGTLDARGRTTVTDLAMLADLATFHAHKTHAAVGIATYQQTDAAGVLPTAYGHAIAMQDAWATLAERGDQYHDNLVFGRGPAFGDGGTWADRMDEIDADVDALATLADETDETRPATTPIVHSEPVSPIDGRNLETPETVTAGEAVPVRLHIEPLREPRFVHLHYRRANQRLGQFHTVSMDRTDDGYAAVVPGDAVTEHEDLLVYGSVLDHDERVTIVPGLWDPTDPFPYRVLDTR